MEGCEVVIGIVETHSRKETEALLEGMPIMPHLIKTEPGIGYRFESGEA